MSTVIDWIAFQIVTSRFTRIQWFTGKVGAWFLERAGSWAYR